MYRWPPVVVVIIGASTPDITITEATPSSGNSIASGNDDGFAISVTDDERVVNVGSGDSHGNGSNGDGWGRSRARC